eukprot:13538559-Alexandrium_andersonii.AAC.1
MPGVVPGRLTAVRHRDLEECQLGFHKQGVGRVGVLAHEPPRVSLGHGAEAERRLALGVADAARAVDPTVDLEVVGRE